MGEACIGAVEALLVCKSCHNVLISAEVAGRLDKEDLAGAGHPLVAWKSWLRRGVNELEDLDVTLEAGLGCFATD